MDVFVFLLSKFEEVVKVIRPLEKQQTLLLTAIIWAFETHVKAQIIIKQTHVKRAVALCIIYLLSTTRALY